MMLSVLVWLGMWGQRQTGLPVLWCTPGGYEYDVAKAECVPPKPAEHVLTEPVDPPYAWAKPAEHVIEIKTVRTASNRNSYGKCPAGFSEPYCQRVTRELWIDGTKFGVIKGLD